MVKYTLLALALTASALHAADRLTLNFNPDWRFIKDDPANAQAPKFDDSGWALVSTPHTFNDVDTFDNWSTPGHRGEQIQWSGRTWYRKTFTAPLAWKNRKVFVEFEAARQVAEVYLNGEKLGVCKTGFTPFGFELTPHLRFDAPNVLAVMVDNRFMRDPLDVKAAAELQARGVNVAAERPNSGATGTLAALQSEFNQTIPDRIEDLQADQIPWNNPHWHPAHGGIYRNVKLYVTDPLHISLPLYSFLETVGPYAYATRFSPDMAEIAVEVPIENGRPSDETVELRVDVIDAEGKTALSLTQSQSVKAGQKAEFKVAGAITRPKYWEPSYPHLYRVICSLAAAGKTVDSSEVPLGLRSARWTVDHGLYLNGEYLKLRGWGQKPTDEWPGLGAAQPDWLHFYTLQLMREAGGNFVRWGHSAAGPTQILAGDRLGIIADQPGVEGESDTIKAAWKLRVAAFRDTLIYFRNNPSILIWEGGNQKVIREHVAELRALMDKYDPHGGRAYAHRRSDAVTAEFQNVTIGTEGGHEFPNLPVVEGEYDREESPRRVWDHASPPNFGYPEAKGMTYQLTSEQFAANQVAQYQKIAPLWHAGGANWIFSDSTSGGRVPAEVARASGEVDGVRLPKEAYYACAVIFSDQPRVHIIGHWSYPAGVKKDVYVVSNAPRVELLVNGKSVGPATVTHSFLFTFKDVAFEPGEIKAVAYRENRIVATQVKRTAGPAVALKITPIVAPRGLMADGADVALFDVEAVDERGERFPTFQQRVDFELEGPGVWRGGYNSGKVDSNNHRYLDLEAGVNRVAVRSTRIQGTITIKARGAGLKPAQASVTSRAFSAQSGIATEFSWTPVASLPSTAPARPRVEFVPSTSPTVIGHRDASAVGKHIRRMAYTGPQAAIVQVQVGAAEGRKAYADEDLLFPALPESIVGADWIPTGEADRSYSAVDLIEVSALAEAEVTVAFDQSLSVPDWLSRDFKKTDASFRLGGSILQLYTRRVARDESITLGSNGQNTQGSGRMYLVFVKSLARQ